MLSLGSSALGITLILVGVGFLLITPLLLNLVPRLRSDKTAGDTSLPFKSSLPQNENAVIIVSSGGRITHLNDNARSWFGLLPDETPNLERMARNARPSDAFLNLCAAPGQIRFNLQQSLVEAASYSIPNGDQQDMLVTLHRPQLTGLEGGGDELSNQALNIFTEISQSMTASLDLETTISSILESVDHLIPSDFSEITIYDDSLGLFTPYRYITSLDGMRRLEKAEEQYKTEDGYSGYITKNETTLLVDDIRDFEPARPVIDLNTYPFLSYLGTPLMIRGEIIGTLELVGHNQTTFGNADKGILDILAGNAAVALQNAITHFKEQQRATEMAGLADLAQIGSRLNENQDLYQRLIDTISPLLNVEILGFLTYNESQRTLEGKTPFQGMPDQFAELYRTTIIENSPAEAVWNSNTLIHATNVFESPELDDLGLSALIQAAGIRDTILIPLNVSGRSLGYIQAANKRDGTLLAKDDIRLLTIIVGQVAPILENAALIQDARRRTQRAETMRRIASLAGSNATLPEILRFTMLEIGRFFQADQAALLLLNQDMGEMQLDQESQFGLTPDTVTKLSHLSLQEFTLSEIVTTTTMPLLFNNVPEEQNLPSSYKLITEQFQDTKSLLVAPLIIREKGIGELIIATQQADQYELNDIQSLTNAAGLIASAIESSNLHAQTDETLQSQVDHLTTLSHLSRDLNISLNPKDILKQIFDQTIRATGADSCNIKLLNRSENDQSKTLTLEVGHNQNHTITELEEMVFDRIETQIIEDFSATPHNPTPENAVSALISPIAYQGKIFGLINLSSTKPNHFDKNKVEIIQALSIHAAIALGNAKTYLDEVEHGENLYRRAQTLDKLYKATQSIDMETSLEDALKTITFGIQETSQFEVALLYIYDPIQKHLTPTTVAGLPIEEFDKIKDRHIPWEYIDQMIQPKYKEGNSYYIPFSEEPDSPSLIPEYAVLSYTIADDNAENSWSPGDQLFIPLQKHNHDPLGIIAIDAPQNGLRPNQYTLEALEIFAHEATLVIESIQKLETLKTQLDAISSEANRDKQASQFAEDHLPILLGKDLQQTIAIQQLHDRAQNIRVGLDIAETVNRQPDRESVLDSLASQLITQMNLDVAIVAEPSEGGPRLLNQFGAFPENVNTQSLLGQRNPLRQTFQSGNPLFVPNLSDNEEWQDTPLLKNLNSKGFISLPIASNGHVEAVVLAISHTPIANFTKEDEQIYDLIGNQVSITLQNLHLLTETRRRLREVNLLLDFSQQLGSLDSSQIMTTLVESIQRVIPHAHGAMVSIWQKDKKNLITQAAVGYSDNNLLSEISYQSGETPLGQTFADGQPRRFDEVDFASQYNLSPENLLKYRQATGGRVPVSAMLIPIQTSDTILGVITTDNFNTQGAFSEEDQALVASLSQQTALTLDNARLFDEARLSNEELEGHVRERTEELARQHQLSQTLLEISTELSSSLDLDMVLNRTLETLNQAIGADQSSIMLLRPDEEHYVYRAGIGITNPPPIGGRPSNLKVGEGLIGKVIDNRKAELIPDLAQTESWVKTSEETSMHRSAIVAPLIVGTEALGALMLYHRSPNHFTEEHVDPIQAAANQFAISINNGELFRLIRDQAEDLGTLLRNQSIEASRSKAMLEGVADGVLVTDSAGVITLFNDAAERILNLHSHIIVGQSLDDFVGLFGDAAESWMEAIQVWSADRDARKRGTMYSEQITLEDARVVSVHLAPVSTEHDFLGTVSIFRDITHEVEVDRLKSEFVATVSHELRTPLTPIKGYVEFLMMNGAGELNEKQTEFLGIIKSNIDRLTILVNDLLDVSRIEAGKVAMTFQPIDIEEITEESVQLVEQKSINESRPMTFEITIANELPNVYGDLERLRQIMGNLVDNAYKYSPEESLVAIKIKNNESEVQIDIKDKGIGVFPDEQTRIFERFYRGENHLVMATAGTGLGLPIVKQLVEMHNGRIWVTSPGIPGEGSTFSFTIPIYEATPDENGSNEEQ